MDEDGVTDQDGNNTTGPGLHLMMHQESKRSV